MKIPHTSIKSLVVAATVFAAPAAFACDTNLTSVRNEIQKSTEHGVIPAKTRLEARMLRDAAVLLKRSDKEDACEEVVEAASEILRSSAYLTDKKRAVQSVEIAKAQPTFGAEELIGMEVRNLQNEYLGEVEKILIGSGPSAKTEAVLSYGGFLGIGEERVLIPVTKFRIPKDRESVFLDVSKKQLDTADRMKSAG